MKRLSLGELRYKLIYQTLDLSESFVKMSIEPLKPDDNGLYQNL